MSHSAGGCTAGSGTGEGIGRPEEQLLTALEGQECLDARKCDRARPRLDDQDGDINPILIT